MEGVVSCPVQDCPFSVQKRWGQGETERIRCSHHPAHPDFCSECKGLYHYGGSSCAAFVRQREAWLEWFVSGRRAYWTVKAAGDADFARREAEWQEQAAAGLAMAQQRMAEFRADEAWKAANLRRCPNCSRPLQHMGGCSAMICGRDYHGGNAQDGCGHHFDWGNAGPYQQDADGPAVGAGGADAAPAPEQAAEVAHEIMEGVPVTCSLCAEPIVGPCFACVNCPPAETNICVKCEGGLSCEPGSVHDHTHTFIIKTE